MAIDIVYLFFLGIGIWQGFKKGIIETLFGVAALFLGILVSVKLSHNMSVFLRESFGWKTNLLPFISLVSLMLITIFAIRMLSRLIENVAQEIQLGYFNKLLGAALWCLVLSIVFSVLIWLFNQMNLFPESLKNDSSTYVHLIKLAPATFDFFGDMLPYFQGVFDSLRKFLTEPA